MSPPPTSRTGPAPPFDVVLGLGADLCAVARCDRELRRPESGIVPAVLRPAELTRCHRHPHPARILAAFFAAKEAVIKALARARGQGTFWQDIEIDARDDRRPVAILHGRIAELAREAGVRHIHLAWAQSRGHATACAIATGPASVEPPSFQDAR